METFYLLHFIKLAQSPKNLYPISSKMVQLKILRILGGTP